MSNNLSPAVVIFIILCLPFVLNTLEENFSSDHGDSPGDSAEPLSRHPSSRRIIFPSKWLKEKKRNLSPGDDKNIGNSEHDKLFFGKQFDLWDINKFFEYVESLLYGVKQSNDDSLDESADDVKIKIQSPKRDDRLDKSESNEKDELPYPKNVDILNKSPDHEKMKNSETSNTPNKSRYDRKTQNFQNNVPLSNSQLRKNSKIQNPMDKDSMSKSKNSMTTETEKPEIIRTLNELAPDEEIQNPANNDILKKYLNEGEKKKSPNNDSSRNTQPTENSKMKRKNSSDENILDESENSEKTEMQNIANGDYLNKPIADEKVQNSSTIDSDDKLLDSVKMQNPSNKQSSNTPQIPKKSENKMQDHTNEDDLRESTKNEKMQNPSNKGIQRKKISPVKNDKSRKDMTTIASEDDEDSNMKEITSNDTTTNNSSEEETDEDDDYNDDGKENDNDTDEYDPNETDVDDDYENDYDNEDNTNENEIKDDNINKYNDEKKISNGSRTPETTVTKDKKAHNTTTMFPKVLFQTVPEKQDNSETYPRRNKIKNDNNVTSEDAKSQNITNRESFPPEFELTSGEFIDDYINNRRRKIPERKNNQSNVTEALNPNGNNTTSKVISIRIPTSGNNFEENSKSSNSTSSVNENTKRQNTIFKQPQNTGNDILSEKNILPSLIFSEDAKNNSPDQVFLNENSPQNIFTSERKIASSSQEKEKSNEDASLDLVPFQQKLHFTDLPNTFAARQKEYDVLTEPAVLNFQNNDPSVKTLHNSASGTNIYRPETTDPLPLLFNKAVPLQKEGYLNDQYANYFENVETPVIINRKNQHFERKQPTNLKQDILLNFPPVLNQDTPNSPDETRYFTNYRPEMQINAPNTEKPVPGIEMPSKYWISDNLQYNPSFIQSNQDPSATDVANSLIKIDKIMSQVQPDTTTPQNQINKIKEINIQSQSDNLSIQNNFSGQQMLFPQNDTENPFLQSKTNSGTLSDRNKMKSEILPVQGEFKDIQLSASQNGTNNTKELPGSSYNISEINLENNPGNAAVASIVPKTVTEKSFFPKTKIESTKPVNDKFEKSLFFDESEELDQKVSMSVSKFSKSDNPDESLDDDSDEDESTQFEDDEEESSEYEDDDEESYDIEYDDEEESYENEYDDEEESYENEYDEEEESYENEYDEKESDENEYDTEKSTSLSHGAINNATNQMTQNSSSTEANDATESSATFKTQSEAPLSDQKGKFNTILDYIYKFSDNPFFKGLKD